MASKRHPATDEEPPEHTVAEADQPKASGTRTVQVTIPAGQSLSDAADVSGARIEFILMPDAWTPAYLTFLASFDGEKFYDVFTDQNVELTLTNVNVKSLMDVNTKPFKFGYIKLRSGGRNALKPQAEDRTFTFVLVS